MFGFKLPFVSRDLYEDALERIEYLRNVRLRNSERIGTLRACEQLVQRLGITSIRGHNCDNPEHEEEIIIEADFGRFRDAMHEMGFMITEIKVDDGTNLPGNAQHGLHLSGEEAPAPIEVENDEYNGLVDDADTDSDIFRDATLPKSTPSALDEFSSDPFSVRHP